MKAPTEKHLEDWIVANPSKVIPDYWGWDQTKPLITQIVSRQPAFPVGRPDLIIKSPGSLGVIELKKGDIDDHTVIQCLRYAAYLEQISMAVHWNLTNPPDSEFQGPNYPAYSFDEGTIQGYVVGHSIKSQKLLHSCNLLRITPILYDFEGGEYTFEVIPSPTYDSTSGEWAQGAIGQALKEIMIGNLAGGKS